MPNAQRRRRGATLGVALLAAPLALALLDRPVLSYASSESMTPTLDVGDVFLVHPFPTGLRVGDVVVFKPALRDGFAVHRLVAWTPQGWITQGDANPVPDQEAGEPPVPESRIRGRVLSTGGSEVVRVPRAGLALIHVRATLLRAEDAAGGRAGLGAAAIGAFAVVTAAFALTGDPAPPRAPSGVAAARRRVARALFPRGVLGRHFALALLALLAFAASLAAASAKEEAKAVLVIVEDAPEGVPGIARPGAVVPREVEVPGLGLAPSHVFVEAGGDRVAAAGEALIPPFGSARFTFTQLAARETGLQEDSVLLWVYPAVFPPGVTRALHGLLPGSPCFAAAALVALALWVPYRRLALADVPVRRILPGVFS